MIARSVEEWATVAKVSKGIKHLFVEGDSDARLLMQVFGYPEGVDLRTAKEVEKTETPSHPLCGGFKLRLVELSKGASALGIDNLRCLIDSDFESIHPLITGNSSLFFTRYANLPISTFTYEWLKSYLLKAYGFILSKGVWDFLVLTLNFAFAARFLSARQDMPLGTPDIGKYISLKKGEANFDKLLYCARYFNVSLQNSAPFVTKVDQEASLLAGDHRQFINSNDAFDAVYALLRAARLIGGSVSRDSVRSSFLGAADDEHLNDGAAGASTWIT